MAVLTAILVVNAGSSSLKLRILDDADSVVGSADLPPPRGADDTAPVKAAIGPFGDVHAVGHRIVHGGSLFIGPVLIDAGVREQLRALTDLAPLHQPKSLAALNAVSAVLPDVRHRLLRHGVPRHHSRLRPVASAARWVSTTTARVP